MRVFRSDLFFFFLVGQMFFTPLAKSVQISDGKIWYYYPSDCSLFIENYEIIRSNLRSQNSEKEVSEFKYKCNFYLAGSKIKSAKDKTLGAAGNATKGLTDAIKDSPLGSFWQGLTK